MSELQVNFLAVGAAALATFIIGAIWYSPLLFGDRWLDAHGYTAEQMRNTAGRNLVVSLSYYAAMAFVLAVLVSIAGVSSGLHGAFPGCLVWIGFLATLGLSAHLVADQPLSIYWIDAG